MAIFLHMPSESELSYRRFLIADEATMAYNLGFGDHGGCTYRRTPEEVRCWYQKWNHGSKNFYAYILRAVDQRPVGEVALSGASEQPMVNVLIEARYRGQGYGLAALQQLLEYAFCVQRQKAVYDDFPATRVQAEAVFAREGFVRTDSGLLVCTREAFYAHKRAQLPKN